MATQHIATAKRTIQVPCPACGKRARGEIVASGSQSTGFFTSNDEAHAESKQLAQSDLSVLEERLARGERSMLTERKGLALRCAACGYETTAATFNVYFWVLMAGLITAVVGIGVPLALGGTIWYFVRTAKMRARLPR